MGDDLKRYADTLRLVAQKGLEKSRARLRAALRSRYVAYVLAVRQKALIKERIELAKRLEEIAGERFREGAGTKARLMQASLQRIDAESKLIEQQRRVDARYYELLKIAQTAKRPKLEATFIYPVGTRPLTHRPANASLELLKAKSKRFEAEAKINDRTLKSYDLFAEYEHEPDQSIARVGVGVALPVFNRNSQERQIASIRAKQAKLAALKAKREQTAELESLKTGLESLSRHYRVLQELSKKQKELLDLFTEGYKTAQISLLDLIQTQQRLIKTKRQLLQTHYLANLYQIGIDSIEGTLK